MPLYLGRAFDDPRGARVTEKSRQRMILSQRRRPGDFQSEIDVIWCNSSVPNNLTLAASERTSIF